VTDLMNPVTPVYDRLAPIYDRRWRSYGDATLRAVLDALDYRGDERILDVACGTGELESRLLARWPALHIVATDLSSGMLNQAVEKDKKRHVFWIHADVANLPLADNSFDFVFCSSSFHYFRSPTRSLQEMYRVLRPGGALVCVDWCDDYLTCKACSWWLRWTDPAFYRTYALRECHTLLEQTGFQVVRAKRFRISWLWGLMRFVCRRGPEQDSQDSG
jgi:ubiquinone/menaquinone biosynthesis C-methylase UbiE